ATDQTDEFFVADVIIDISRLPQLNMVGSNILAYVASLGDNNDVIFNGAPVAGSPFNAGDTFTVTADAGDLLECSTGCFAITPTDATAAWSTETYAATQLSTYMG